ncbi:DUF4132 domain-containing protein [Nocardia sp. NPDC055321]
MNTHDDEDLWVIPEEWRARATPVRGLNDPPPHIPNPHAVEESQRILDLYRPQLELSLNETRAQGNTRIAEAGSAYLNAAGTLAEPLGAAAVWTLLQNDTVSCGCHRTDTHHAHRARMLGDILDGWIHTHGYAFATEAALCCTVMDELPRGLPSEFPRGAFPLGPMPSGYEVPWTFRQLGLPLRTRLATAPEDEYRAAMARAEPLRTNPGSFAMRLATSYLFPERQDWVDADLTFPLPKGGKAVRFLLSALSTTDQLAFRLTCGTEHIDRLDGDFFALLIRLGVPATTLIVRQFQQTSVVATEVLREVAQLLVEFPTDEAYQALLDRRELKQVAAALPAANRRYPRRAMRLLSAQVAESDDVALIRMFRKHAVEHRELVADYAHPDTHHLVALRHHLPWAQPDTLPELLISPPWTRRRKRPTALFDTIEHRRAAPAWRPGEKERWREYHGAEAAYGYHRTLPFDDQLRATLPGHTAHLLADAPDAEALHGLRTIRPGALTAWRGTAPTRPLTMLLGRFGAEAVGFVLAAATARPAALARALFPVDGTAVTLAMLRWHASHTLRAITFEWFDRHIGTAATDLIAVALGPAGADRTLAENAVLDLTARGHRAAIDAAAAHLGVAAESAMCALLEGDPELLRSAPTRSVPRWLFPELLPQIRLRYEEHALPEFAAGYLITMLMMSTPADPYPGVARVRAVLNQNSLAEFAWEIFESWCREGHPGKDVWALHALGLLGTDRIADRLVARIESWAGSSAHGRATAGIAALATMGTASALARVETIARESPSRWLRAEAERQLYEVLRARGLTPGEFPEQLVPRLDLDDSGTRALDYGPRQFTIGIDRRMRPTVTSSGRHLSELPKPAPTDDPELARTARRAFRTFTEDLQLITSERIRRFEHDMLRGRRWRSDAHHRHFADHPVLRQLGRRVVWATFAPDGAITGSFRIAEDLTLADVSDARIEVGPDTLVGVAHPLHLGADRDRWRALFADYELLQPFEQLHRSTPAFTPEEAAESVNSRFADITVPTAKLMDMVANEGWSVYEQDCIVKRIGPDLVALALDSGNTLLDLEAAEHTILFLEVGKGKFGDLDPIAAAELLRRLERLTGARS